VHRRWGGAYVRQQMHPANPIATPNGLDPHRMSAEARIAEIGRILAAGLIRIRARQSSALSVDRGDSCLDFPPGKSGADATMDARGGGP